MSPSKVYKMGFRWPKDTKMVIDDVFLSDDEEYGSILTAIRNVNTDNCPSRAPIYSLDGRLANPESLKKGVYISNGKKILVK